MSLYSIIFKIVLILLVLSIYESNYSQSIEKTGKIASSDIVKIENIIQDFSYTKFLEYHKKTGYRYEIPDSDFVVEKIININANVILIPVSDNSINHIKAESDIYVVINDSLIMLSEIKDNRKGQLSYLGNDRKQIYLVFDCFVDTIDKYEVISDSPLYCNLFKYSELWVFTTKDYKVNKIDKDDGEYQKLKFGEKSIEVEIFPKYTKQLYYKDFNKE